MNRYEVHARPKRRELCGQVALDPPKDYNPRSEHAGRARRPPPDAASIPICACLRIQVAEANDKE